MLTKREQNLIFRSLKKEADSWLKERHRLINGQSMWTSRRDEEHYHEICDLMKKIVMINGDNTAPPTAEQLVHKTE